MIEVKFRYKVNGVEQDWDDSLKVTSMETAEEEIKAILIEFNRVEKQRYGDTAEQREFSRITAGIKFTPHKWNKIGFYHGAIVPYRCLNCRLKIEIHAISLLPNTECFPERVCTICNKEFKTEINLQRHNERKHSNESR